MLTKKRAVLAGLSLLLLAGVAALGVLVVRLLSLPVYVASELPPTAGYGNNTLTVGDMTYVSSKAEFRLWAIDPPLGFALPIGRTADGWRIYRPYGQGGQDYVFVTGDMLPQTVYRSSRVAPLELRDLRVAELRFPARRSATAPRRSQDPALIAEVMASLTGTPVSTIAPDYAAGDEGYRLDLLPAQMPGLAYAVDTLIVKTGQVYLSTDTELGQGTWLPAGPQFTRWLRE